MRKRTIKKTVSLSVVILVLSLLFFGGSALAEEPEIRVTIRGSISNTADVGEFISAQTRLQLYPCETTGKMNMHMNEKGSLEPVPGQEKPVFYMDGFNRLVPQSGLPGTGLPVFGGFTFFKVRGLMPGSCYKICVMTLDPPYPGMIALSDKDGNPIKFTIPEAEDGENSENIVIDLSDKELLIPTI